MCTILIWNTFYVLALYATKITDRQSSVSISLTDNYPKKKYKVIYLQKCRKLYLLRFLFKNNRSWVQQILRNWLKKLVDIVIIVLVSNCKSTFVKINKTYILGLVKFQFSSVLIMEHTYKKIEKTLQQNLCAARLSQHTK